MSSDPFYASSLRHCPGPNAEQRRGFLRMGLDGFASLSLPGMLRLRASSPHEDAGKKEEKRGKGVENITNDCHR